MRKLALSCAEGFPKAGLQVLMRYDMPAAIIALYAVHSYIDGAEAF